MASRLQLPAAILGALGASTLALMVLTAPTHAASLQAQMQEQADRAALAGVNILGSRTNDHEAIEATQQALAAIPGVAKEVTASVADLTVTVKLSSKTFDVVSTARYVAPDDQPAEWAWASRQHFAANRAAVVLGSNCMRTCGVARMR
jgi:hypothetical protein